MNWKDYLIREKIMKKVRKKDIFPTSEELEEFMLRFELDFYGKHWVMPTRKDYAKAIAEWIRK